MAEKDKLGGNEMDFRIAKQEYDDKYYKGLSDTGLFYAFSDESFEKQKKPGTTAENYTSYFGVGDVIHLDDVPKLEHFLTEVAPKLKKEFLAKTSKDDFILHELKNYECAYTGDISEAVESVMNFLDIDKETATKECQRVYNQKYRDEEPVPPIEDIGYPDNCEECGEYITENCHLQCTHEDGASR